ncbi:N-acetylglucosaminyl phosphatidylinositol deacetylase [Planctomycetales bacterium 10988]|nr:N-acetylglucosaminyl phosphatidylinositol deacetylase [Planctomycetales bacterium 10988]
MSDAYPQLDVIAVGAHPDDVEIACGGTLAKLVKLGYKVGIIDLTNGEPTPRCPDPEIRLAEAKKAAEVLGVQIRVTLDMPNRRLFDSFEHRVQLGKEFRKYRPKLVLGFGEKTPLASPDHWQAMQITDAGIFYSRLTKWDAHFDHLPVHTISAQLYYTLAFRALELPEVGSKFVMDISDTLEQKLESIRCYETQFPPEKQHIFERVKAFNMSHGMTAGYQAGEIFVSPGTIGTHDLMKFVIRGEIKLPAEGPESPDEKDLGEADKSS